LVHKEWGVCQKGLWKVYTGWVFPPRYGGLHAGIISRVKRIENLKQRYIFGKVKGESVATREEQGRRQKKQGKKVRTSFITSACGKGEGAGNRVLSMCDSFAGTI